MADEGCEVKDPDAITLTCSDPSFDGTYVRKKKQVKTKIVSAALTFAACVLSWWGGAYYANQADTDPVVCEAGQVYVVDTDQCVAGDDHASHNIHAGH